MLAWGHVLFSPCVYMCFFFFKDQVSHSEILSLSLRLEIRGFPFERSVLDIGHPFPTDQELTTIITAFYCLPCAKAKDE